MDATMFDEAMNDFKEKVSDAGFAPVMLATRHWIILGGAATVQVYPTKKGAIGMIHLHGTKNGDMRHVNGIDGLIRLLRGGRIPGKCKSISPPQSRKAREYRTRLYERGPFCHWCGLPFSSIKEATLDHVIPRSRGGLNRGDNYAIACAKCNCARGDRFIGSDTIGDHIYNPEWDIRARLAEYQEPYYESGEGSLASQTGSNLNEVLADQFIVT